MAKSYLSLSAVFFLGFSTIVSFLVVSGQNVLENCDPDDANCLCREVTNASTCFCDWGYVLNPAYTPSIGKMKFCTRFCTPGRLHCWTSSTSHTQCVPGSEECVCAFGYTAVLYPDPELILCEPVNCHKKYLLNNNEVCDCPDHSAKSSETQCNCIQGFVGNKTNHPGFCKGFQCEPGEGSFCSCENGATDPISCKCQTAAGLPTKYSFLVPEDGEIKRKCIEGGSCEEGEVLNSFGSNVTECTKHECIKGTPFCDTGSVYRFCEDGFTADWDMTCIPIECNDKILNTDVSFCTCPKNSDGDTIEKNCRCFVNYVSDFDKPGQCRTLCDVNMAHCVSENLEACTTSNNQNCKCEEGYQAALLDTDENGNIVNVDAEGRMIHFSDPTYYKEIGGNKVGCVPVCDTRTDANCQKNENNIIQCKAGFTPNWEQVCTAYECNAGFEPENYHCDCDQDAFGSFSEVMGLIIPEDSKNPLTCYCLPGYISEFMKEERFCKEQVCNPLDDPFCSALANDDGTLRLETATCNQWYVPYRDLAFDTDPEDSADSWKGEHLPVCQYTKNVTFCTPGTDGCDPTCMGSNCECDYENGYTAFNGHCFRLTCDLATVQAQYPEGNGYKTAEQICIEQFNVDFNKQMFYCSPGFYPNGTGGCNYECSSYFPACTKYADFDHFQCEWGYTPNLFVNSEGFLVDNTCVEVECNSLKEHCVCPSWYGQTKIKIEKDCECEMGFASDGLGGCTEICFKEGRADGVTDCKRNCVGPVCECGLGHTLEYDRLSGVYTCTEITCHLGNANCSCGEDPNDLEAVKYIEETACECVNNTLPLEDGTCVEPVLRSCVTCSSDDILNACVEDVDINGIRGITTKYCDKYSGYFGCWVKQHAWKNGTYYFERGCGYYCTDSYDNHTYCFTNQKDNDEEEIICQQCCRDEDDCNIMQLLSLIAPIYLDKVVAILTAPVLLLFKKILE